VQAAKLIEEHKISAILSTSPPVATHLAALWLKRRYGLRWVADFRDPLDGNPFRGIWYDSALERVILRYADSCVANTDVLAEAWRVRHPGAADKVTVIWNGFDPAEEVRAALLGERQRRVLAHVGSIYSGRTPALVLKSMRRLIHTGVLDSSSLTLDLVGDVEDVSLGDYSDLRRLACLRCINQHVPRAESLQIMIEADYLLLLDLNSKGTCLQVPAKLFDYVRAGRPILAITARNSPAERILVRSGVPNTCIYPDDAENVVDTKLLDFLHLPSEPVLASRWFWNQFDGRRHAAALAHILKPSLRLGAPVDASIQRAAKMSGGANNHA
jgi:glycosyltransferase involved in cell wall biosynthesis